MFQVIRCYYVFSFDHAIIFNSYTYVLKHLFNLKNMITEMKFSVKIK